MNYYNRYPGDYMRDTAVLTMAQHGAFTALLDTYYSTEHPIPEDEECIYAICKAVTDSDKASAMKVVRMYFTLKDGFWRNARCDREIKKAKPKIAAARANGSRGGRKPKPTGNPLATHEEPNGNPSGFHEEPTGNPLATHAGKLTRSGVGVGVGVGDPNKSKSTTAESSYGVPCGVAA